MAFSKMYSSRYDELLRNDRTNLDLVVRNLNGVELSSPFPITSTQLAVRSRQPRSQSQLACA